MGYGGFVKEAQVKVLIPNATGPNNLGDLAILTGMVECVREAFPGVSLVVHSYGPQRYSRREYPDVKAGAYEWAVFQNTGTLSRSARMLAVLYWLGTLVLRVHLPLPRHLRELEADYRSADLVLFAGGGYLRSNEGVKQSLNLLMQLLPFFVANRLGKKTVVAPVSFGPFAWSWQRTVTAWVLRQVSAVAIRESISLSLLQKLGVDGAFYSSDAALLISPVAVAKPAQVEVGFTVRKWFDDSRQAYLETAVATALAEFCRPRGYRAVPVVQVHAPLYEESDAVPAARIADRLRALGVNVAPVVTFTDIRSALERYGTLRLLVGMRMHSNILAAVQGVPFVALSYEHKTEGIARDLGVERYCLSVGSVNGRRLTELINEVESKHGEVSARIKASIARILRKNKPYWIRKLKQLTGTV